MGAIAIRLDPKKLNNPDLDIRYEIPGKIEELTSGAIRDDGYDYLDECGNIMVIYLSSEEPERQIKAVIKILSENVFHGNHILESAEIGIKVLDKYEVIYPPGASMELAFE